MEECLLCKTEQPVNNAQLCSYCSPNTCLNCYVDGLYYDEEANVFNCSHGCEYDVYEYTTRKVYTTILNGTSKEKLSLAGSHVEYIIPDTSVLTIYDSLPAHPTPGTVRGVHYTSNAEELVENGFDNSLQRENNTDFYSNTIRENAAYAWPYTPEFTETEFEWNLDYVIFEVPTDAVFVSSYRFLDFVRTNDKWSIPLEKYDSELTFTPVQLFETVSELNRPMRSEDLLFEL